MHSNLKAKMVWFGIIVVLTVMGIAEVASQCGVCMPSRVSCETESTYHICVGDQKIGPYTCEADEVCTNSPNVCERRSNIQGSIRNVCGVNDNGNGYCEDCSNDHLFTCASRTQGARCVNGVMSTTVLFDCGEDEICVTEAYEIFETVCVPKCAFDFIGYNVSCNNEVYTPPTLEPPTTPTLLEQQGICRDAVVGNSKRFFFAYADSSCRNYVYCERDSVTNPYFISTFAGSCHSPNPYFNTAIERCQARVPENCRTDAPTTEGF